MKKTQKKQKSVPASPKPKLDLASGTKKSLVVVAFMVLFFVSTLALLGAAGPVGGYVAEALKSIFGYIAYVTPIAFLMIGYSLSKQKIEQDRPQHFYFRIYLGIFLLISGLAGLIHIFYMRDGTTALNVVYNELGGGYLGALFAGPLFQFTGFWASFVILIAVFVAGFMITFDIPLSFNSEKSENEALDKSKQGYEVGPVKINSIAKSGFSTEKVIDKNKVAENIAKATETIPPAELRKPLERKVNTGVQDEPFITAPSIAIDDRKDWKLPPFDLLEDSKNTVDSGNIEANVANIQKSLSEFGIEVEMGEVNVGPTVTQYTLRPSTGIKLSQIAALQNDLALSLSAQSLRMELPIPGKALVGIEIPNKTTSIVRLREVLQTEAFVRHPSKLAFALGRDVAGHPIVGDLAKMPHMLIAGATGSGKSVCINSFFISLLYRNTPQDVKFIVVDPKRVELNLYNGIPHLLTPVITDHDKAVNSLKWAVAEMDRRYRIMAEAGKRNIADYNETALAKMYYIVILIDELADLMAVAQRDVEAAIVRLSQMARAVGIHLVLATQRPSVEVITGLIKANITSRIAFAGCFSD